MILYIVLGVVALLLIYGIISYNSFVSLNNKVKEAFSTLDVYLKKRWDLIPNLVEVVKGYAKHEKETLEDIVKLRNSSYDSMSDSDKIKADEKLTNGINKIMAIAESYPELKASENYKELSSQLVKIEDDIANSRKYYNGVVRMFNNNVEMFPSNIIAKILGYSSKDMFEVDSNERESDKVEL